MIPDPQRPKSQEYLFHMERPSNLTSPIEQPQAKPHMYKVLFIETFLYVRCRTRFLFFLRSVCCPRQPHSVRYRIANVSCSDNEGGHLTSFCHLSQVLCEAQGEKEKEERHSMRLFSKGRSRRILNYRYNDSKRATGCFPLENMSLCKREIFEL